MGLFTPPEDILIRAMTAKQPQVRLEHCIGSVNAVFKNALKKERRLLAFLSGYESSYMKKGLVQLSHDYEITIRYQDSCPNSIDDVLVDNGAWEAESILEKHAPKEVMMITENASEIARKLNEILPLILSRYEGVFGTLTNSMSFDSLSSDTLCSISYAYLVPQMQLHQYQVKANFAAKTIWREILGRAKAPQFVKPFLAFSYLMQNCYYDQRAFDEAESNPGVLPSDPIPHLAYGPLVEKRGICSGLAWAYKRLMDEAGIECTCVIGFLTENSDIRHMWNMVKLDGQYYHVDTTWGIENNGVTISGLLQPDSMMKGTHIWDAKKYPQAKGMRFDYDYIEDFLAENGDEYIDDGANEDYFFPNEIIE